MTFQPIPQPPPAPPKLKRFGFVALGVASVVGLFVGGMVGGLSSASTTAAPAPVPTVTVTATVEPEPEPTVAEEPEPEPAEQAVYQAKKSEWAVKLKVRDKQCFGSAGCNVTVKLDPQYTGTRALPDTGTIEVFYRITGDESGPITGSYTVTGGQIHYTEEVALSTKGSGTKVKAKITDVTYSEN